jgi:hypothetical protein
VSVCLPVHHVKWNDADSNKKNWSRNKFHNLSFDVAAVSAAILQASSLKYVYINKQLVGFQNCCVAVSELC